MSAITYVHGSGIFWITADGTKKVVCILVSAETPDNLDISGADVNGLADDIVIAAGSVLIAAEANYIALEDGTFTEKQ